VPLQFLKPLTRCHLPRWTHRPRDRRSVFL